MPDNMLSISRQLDEVDFPDEESTTAQVGQYNTSNFKANPLLNSKGRVDNQSFSTFLAPIGVVRGSNESVTADYMNNNQQTQTEKSRFDKVIGTF